MAYLILHTLNAPPKKAELLGCMLLGRAKCSDIWLNDTRVSRTHCQFAIRDGRWIVADLDSGNGTYLNGKRLSKPTTLRDGDELKIGTATIAFHAGNINSDRPADPIEAALARGPATDADASFDSTTLIGQPAPMIRPIPNLMPKPCEEPAVPLAFTRPPPQPFVRNSASC